MITSTYANGTVTIECLHSEHDEKCVIMYAVAHAQLEVRMDNTEVLFRLISDVNEEQKTLLNNYLKDADLLVAYQALAGEAYNTAADKGFHDNDRSMYEGLALIVCELAEAVESVRDNMPPDKHLPQFLSTEVELADVIIRILDMSIEKRLDVAGALLAKMAYNKTRPRKHGRAN